MNFDDDISINASMDNIGRAMFGNAPMSNNIMFLIKEMKELQEAMEKGKITYKQKIRLLQIKEILKNSNLQGF